VQTNKYEETKMQGPLNQSIAGHHIQRDSCSKWSSQRNFWRPTHV